MNQQKKKIKVIDLFAGVGGFHVGLKNVKHPSTVFEIVWSNQWEPSTKTQHAADIYKLRFPNTELSIKDIAQVDIKEIPDHDLLTGGFPCQDYSVARTLSHAAGLTGKKGVLWWQIERIIREKREKSPKYLLLENVDRLLKSPASQRGRDFAVMLASLWKQGYALEWRVINAAEYGMPQRRRRVYMVGYKQNTKLFQELKKSNPMLWITQKGVIANEFKVTSNEKIVEFNLFDSLSEITEKFNKGKLKSPFENSGFMIDGKVFTLKTKPSYSGIRTKLKNVIIKNEKDIPNEFFVNNSDIEKWNILKGAKKEERVTKDGFVYHYSEGGMIFPDSLESPSRTIVTGEGGSTPSRFKHVIKTESGKLRRLMPIELERLNMFPDNHTKEASDTKRAFFMGNALVVGVITKLGEGLAKHISYFEKYS